MKKNRLVIALGGNALGNTPGEQLEKAKACAELLADLTERGYELILAHGNGPQVGMINLGLAYAAGKGVIQAEMPLAECTALSQGYIGFHLQNALQAAMKRRGIKKEVATLLTQVEVDPSDPAFLNPTKPVGAFYTKEEAERQEEAGYVMKEDAGLPRHRMAFGLERATCCFIYRPQASFSSSIGSLFWGGRHFTMLEI